MLNSAAIAAADGLSCITPEVEAFVSRANRSHADPWLQQVDWAPTDRTLTLRVRKPPPGGMDLNDGGAMLASLPYVIPVRIYFPANLKDKPVCLVEDRWTGVEDQGSFFKFLGCFGGLRYREAKVVLRDCGAGAGAYWTKARFKGWSLDMGRVGGLTLCSRSFLVPPDACFAVLWFALLYWNTWKDDALRPAAEAANDRLRPLASNSVLAVVKTVLTCVKREMLDTSWDRRLVSVALPSAPDATVVGARAILAAIREDPVGADLALALLSMAMSSYRRDTVSVPFPNQLESAGGQRAYAAFLSSLEALPTMSEMSAWVDPAKVLQLPHMAVLGLHFVLAYLPAKLRLASATYAESIRLRTGPGHGSGPGPSLGLTLGKSSPCLVQGAHPKAGKTLTAAPGHGMAAGDGDPILTPGSCRQVFDVVLPCDPTFDAEAKRNGSVVAYYGSSPEHFHSVLNSGLRIPSGPRLLKHGGGAVSGDAIHVSVSLDTAALFAARGDGRGVSVWSKSTFGQIPGFEAGPVPGNGNPRHVRRPKIFRHRIVAKCRILKGDGVKEVKGWGSKEGYFVVSDTAKVRVEGLFLLSIGMPLVKKPAVLSHEALKPVDEVSVNENTARSSSSFGRHMVRRSGSREQTLSQALSGRGEEGNTGDALLGCIKFLSGVLLVGMVPITVGVMCLLYMERLA